MEQNKNITAVQSFIAELKKWSVYESATTYTFRVPLNVFVRMEMEAKQMEKEQHSNTWIDGRIEYNGDDNIGKEKTFEEYYNETYSSQEK
jgi:hypothetical protein